MASHKRSWSARVYGCWFAACFAVCATAAVVLACLLPGPHRRRRAMRFTSNTLFRLARASPQISGDEHLPPGPAVAVANHASYLDGLLLTAVLPERYQFVIKREVTRVPVMHFVLRRVGAHFVERANSSQAASDLRSILRTAGSGGSLAFFPEGTFTAEPGLRAFRNGAFALAQRSAVPLVPVTLRGTREMLPAGRLLPVPAKLGVVIHAPVVPAADMPPQLALQRCREAILDALDEPDLTAPGAGGRNGLG